MLELDPCLAAGETPVYGAFGGVALGFPCTHFSGERLLVGNALIQALAPKRRELYLGHVQS